LAEHARRRVWPARYASLRVAARRDRDLDHWLHTTDEIAAPDLRYLDAATVEAVVLGLIRKRRKDLVALWIPAASAMLRELTAQWLRTDHIPVAVLRRASAAYAVAADRAGLVEAISPSEMAEAYASPAWWALTGRHRITPETANWLSSVPQPLLDALLRRMAGADSAGDAEFDDHCRAFMPDLPPLALPSRSDHA